MSALGQKQTWRSSRKMSALPTKADIDGSLPHVCFVPIADITSRKLVGCCQMRTLKRHAFQPVFRPGALCYSYKSETVPKQWAR